MKPNYMNALLVKRGRSDNRGRKKSETCPPWRNAPVCQRRGEKRMIEKFWHMEYESSLNELLVKMLNESGTHFSDWNFF